MKVNVSDFSLAAPAAVSDGSDDETLIEDTDKKRDVVVADVANEVRVSVGKSGFI